MTNCIFCKIINREIPSNIIYEDDYLISFYDVAPQAPVHFLVVPKEHIASVSEITPENSQLIARIFERISIMTKEMGIDQRFRVVNNCGERAGQTVKHLHFHVLGWNDDGEPNTTL